MLAVCGFDQTVERVINVVSARFHAAVAEVDGLLSVVSDVRNISDWIVRVMQILHVVPRPFTRFEAGIVGISGRNTLGVHLNQAKGLGIVRIPRRDVVAIGLRSVSEDQPWADILVRRSRAFPNNNQEFTKAFVVQGPLFIPLQEGKQIAQVLRGELSVKINRHHRNRGLMQFVDFRCRNDDGFVLRVDQRHTGLVSSGW